MRRPLLSSLRLRVISRTFGAGVLASTSLVVSVGASAQTTTTTTNSKVASTASPTGSGSTYVQLILDASGSMYAELPAGGTRIEAAKEVLSNFISKLPVDPTLNVGLRIYGATVAPGKTGACQDSKLVLPMKGIDRVALRDTVVKTRPKGSTPIAYSLEKAADDFAADKSRKLIVLVTDGIESCDGDLKKAIQIFTQKGIVVDLRIIGIDLDAAAQKSFQGLGTFENATSAEALAAAIGKATQGVTKAAATKLPVTVKLTSAGKPVTSGPKVAFVSTVGTQTKTEFSVVNGAYTAQLAAGTYKAEILTAGSPPISVAGLAVAVGAANAFTFEIGQLAPVKLDFTPKPARAGGMVTVAYSGAPATSTKDWIAIAKKSDPDGTFSHWQLAKGTTGTVDLTVPDVLVDLELRYMLVNPDGSTRVIGRSAPFVAQRAAITLTAPTEAPAGSAIKVAWTGPNNALDYVTVVKKGAPAGTFLSYQYTSAGSPISLNLPPEPGAYEIRYSNDTSRLTLASRPITLTKSTYGVDNPAQAVAGSEIAVKWTGPNNPSDYITIVKKGAAEGTFGVYAYTNQGNPIKLVTPITPGDYEVRYSSDNSKKTLATRPITLIAATYSLSAPAEVKTGSKIQIRWSGPNNPSDYVTIVKKGAPVGTFTEYFYTRNGNPGTLSAPVTPGAYELRYSTEAASPNPTLFTLLITVK
jgi:Ca-activated chloride channel homolog